MLNRVQVGREYCPMSSDVSLKLDTNPVRRAPRHVTRALEMVVFDEQREVVGNPKRARDLDARASIR